MCRYVLIALVVAVVLLMAVAVLVVSLYGWPGFLVLVAGLLVLAFVLKKAFPRILMRTVTRPMRQLGKVLRGATLTVHTITRCDPPEPMPDEDDPDDEPERIADRAEDDEDDEDDEGVEDDADEPNPADLDWYHIDFTVTPRDVGSSEGRVLHRTSWAPALLSFHLPKADRPRSPTDMTEAFMNQFGTAEVQLEDLGTWTGTGFEETEGEVFGEGRFRARVGVGRDVWTIVLMYAHFTPIGEIRIPRIDVTPGREP